MYIGAVGIDNWAPFYVTEELRFDAGDAVNTILLRDRRPGGQPPVGGASQTCSRGAAQWWRWVAWC
ncbi:hypothetical protein QJS66_15270 [Kocuria rhizophila]|nr:hypothetical protein QJS66_15270 [Kocuria rhizophila]